MDKFPHVTSTMDVENTKQDPESSLILEVYGIERDSWNKEYSGGMAWTLACLYMRRTNQQEFGEI